MSKYEDWADWAGDHPEQAEADLRAEREKAAPMVLTAEGWCEHTEVYSTGHCADCGVPIEGFEPDDSQIPGSYEIGKAAA